MNRNQAIAVVIALVVVGGFFLSREGFIFNKDNNENNMDANVSNSLEGSSGLIIKDEVVGSGGEALSGTQVSVHYTGTFKDGTKFDSSYDRGEPIKFVLGSGMVIKGWEDGLLGMKVGGKRHLEIPPELAYGPADFPSSENPVIPGGSTLIFDVELVGVESVNAQ